MVSFRFIGGNPWRLMVMFLIGAALLSAVASSTVTTVIFMAIAMGLLKALDISPGSRYGEMLILSTAWAALLGGIITPAGTPPNLIGMGMISESLDYQMGFGRWVLVGFPMALASGAVMLAVLWFSVKDELKTVRFDPVVLREEYRRMGAPSKGEKIAGLGLASAIVLWLLPDAASITLGSQHPVAAWILEHLNVATVALLIACLMFLIPVDWKERKFAITWNQAAEGIEWGTLALVAGALGIGQALASPTVGMGGYFSTALGGVAGPGSSPFLPLTAAVVFTVFLTSFISNNAAISIVAPVLVSLGSAPDSTLNPIAAVVAVAIASSMSFILPCSTPATAIVFGSGYVRILTMFNRGLIIASVGALLCVSLTYLLADFIFPWSPA
jgi:sodium-dependent dicarboxylate transporter 2/3/5